MITPFLSLHDILVQWRVILVAVILLAVGTPGIPVGAKRTQRLNLYILTPLMLYKVILPASIVDTLCVVFVIKRASVFTAVTVTR